MRLHTFRHTLGGGWSVPSFPELDSPNTLVIAFGGADYRAESEAFADLARAYPRSVRVGCSTSGEIDGAAIHDRTLTVAVLRFDKTAVRAAWRPVNGPAESFRAAGGGCQDSCRLG
jgi:hypothetical protein